MFPVSFISDSVTLGQSMAQTHYDRVIADGGVLPAGVAGLSPILDSIIAAYSITNSTDFNTKVPVFLDAQYTGYKLGSGSGTTLGQAARTVYAISSSADVTQTTAASQPLLLAHSGVNYWWGSGVSLNYCSTPNASANQITGDIELKACINIGAIVGGDGLTPLICKSNSYYMLLYNNYALKFYNGTTVSSATTTIPTNTTFTKITRSSSTGDINFYTSTESITTNINSVTWTKLGATVSSTSGNLPSSSGTVYVGADGGAWSCLGKIYRATISDSIGGDYLVDFNPNEYVASTSQTSWTSNLGEVWTINTGTAATGYKGVVVSKTIIQSDGIDDGVVTSGTISLPNAFTIYGAIKGYNDEGGNGKSLFGKYNIDGSVFRRSGTQLGAWIGNLGLAYYGATATVTNLNLAIFKRKVSDNNLQANNGAIVNNTNSSAIVDSTVSVFSTSFGSCNGIVNTGIISLNEDTTLQKTALYNIIRSMNGNAF